jgi:hypothetical protein
VAINPAEHNAAYFPALTEPDRTLDFTASNLSASMTQRKEPPAFGRPIGSSTEQSAMWRAFFLATGLFAVILGIECMLIDRASWAGPSGGELIPPEWIPWSLLSTGTVVMLYSFTLPKKIKG